MWKRTSEWNKLVAGDTLTYCLLKSTFCICLDIHNSGRKYTTQIDPDHF